MADFHPKSLVMMISFIQKTPNLSIDILRWDAYTPFSSCGKNFEQILEE